MACSASIRRSCTHALERVSDLMLSQLRRAVSVAFIWQLMSMSVPSSVGEFEWYLSSFSGAG